MLRIIAMIFPWFAVLLVTAWLTQRYYERRPKYAPRPSIVRNFNRYFGHPVAR